MGGSKGYSFQKLTQGGGHGRPLKSGVTDKNQFLTAVSKNVQDQIVSQALGLLISYSTPLSTLAAGLELVKLAINMCVAGAKKYEETGDSNQAIEAAAGVVLDKVKEKLVSEVIRIAVGVAVDGTNIKMNDTSRNIIVDSLSSTVEEAIT